MTIDINAPHVVVDDLGNTNHPIIAAMWARVKKLPDGGEGSPFHLASDAAWVIADDFRRAMAGDTSLLDEWETGWTLERCAEACLKDAEKVAR